MGTRQLRVMGRAAVRNWKEVVAEATIMAVRNWKEIVAARKLKAAIMVVQFWEEIIAIP